MRGRSLRTGSVCQIRAGMISQTMPVLAELKYKFYEERKNVLHLEQLSCTIIVAVALIAKKREVAVPLDGFSVERMSS